MARIFKENTLKPNSKAVPSVRTEGKQLQVVHWNGGRKGDGTGKDMSVVMMVMVMEIVEFVPR
jgi:hypothetical protein